MSANVPVIVNILGKEYQIACPADQKDGLIASAQKVHENMEQIRQSGKVVGVDRIAVMAALNLAHELILLQQNETQGVDHINQKIIQMQERISLFLDDERQLEL